jgi:putative Mn2+ efflux pump MntP
VSDPTSYYVAINVGIGTGIAADAMLATITRARTLRNFKEAIKWATAIGLTHWLFPMVGLLGGWYLARHGVARALVYGLGGAVLIIYILQVLRERSSVAPEDANVMSSLSFWLAVWGVSIDALVTGPGKAAATAHWTNRQVALSFPLVGMVVFVLVLVSTVPAMILHKRINMVRHQSWRALAMFFNVATWVEILVFTWFATLSMIEAGGAMQVFEPSYSLASRWAGALGIVLAGVMGRRVWRAQRIAAQRLVLPENGL